jgi:hypothetical protein
MKVTSNTSTLKNSIQLTKIILGFVFTEKLHGGVEGGQNKQQKQLIFFIGRN